MAASYISVPRDLTKVKSKVMFNLTKRQLICFGMAVLIGVPSFFLMKTVMKTNTAVMGMMVIMMPFFFLAMYEKNGQIGMLVVQDQVWGRVTENRIQGRSTRYYMDEMHLLLREDQTAAYTVEIWKRFRKWGGIPTGITQNVKDLLASKEVENIFENSDFIYMLNQAVGDRQILAKQLNISPHQLSYVTHSGEGEGLLFYGNVILPFVDRFPTNTELYRIMTTRLSEVADAKKEQSA